MRKKLNIAVTVLLISTLTTSGIATGSQTIKAEAGIVDRSIKYTKQEQMEAKGELVVAAGDYEDDDMMAEGSGDGHDVEIDPAEYYGYGYEEDKATSTKGKKKKIVKKDDKVKKGKKKKKKEKANNQKQTKKQDESKQKTGTKKDNNKKNGKYKNEEEAKRKSLLGVKGKVLARDDVYGAPLVIKQGDRLIISEWHKEEDAYYGIERDAKGWRLYSPDRGICPDHGADGSYDPYCEYRQEEIDKQIKWQKEHRDE